MKDWKAALVIAFLLVAISNISDGSEKIKRKIRMLSSGGSIKPEIFLAMAKVESSFKPNAKGDWHCEKKIKDVCIIRKFKARGLFQLHKSASNEAGFYQDPELLFDPDTNITVAVFYLYGIYNKLDGNLWCAVSGFNKGPQNLLKYSETECGDHKYVRKVKAALADLTKREKKPRKVFQI